MVLGNIVWILLRYIGTRAFRSATTRKITHKRTLVMIRSAFPCDADIREMNSLNMEIFGEDLGVTLVDLLDENTVAYIATADGRTVGFMIAVNDGPGAVHISKMGVLRAKNQHDVGMALINIISDDCRVGTYIDKSWLNADKLREFYTSCGFSVKNETDMFYYLERC